MFVAYTDASVWDREEGITTYLGFVIFFEDERAVFRRIKINESKSHIAEALAIKELLSFLNYYGIESGVILFDSYGVKKAIKRSDCQERQSIFLEIKRSLKKLKVRTQVIPRKYNLAHQLSYRDTFYKSSNVTMIKRSSYYKNIFEHPDCFLQPSAYEEFKEIYHKPLMPFHEAQMDLNNKIYYADLKLTEEEVNIYEIHGRRIKVFADTIVKIHE